MTEYLQQKYRSQEEQYDRSNFHRRGTLAAVDEVLRSPRPPVLLLAGETGMGRRYLMEAAVWRARRDGLPVDLLPLDLGDFEEGEGGLRSFLDLQVQRLERRGRSVAPEALSWLQEQAAILAGDLSKAALFALLLSVKGTIDRLRRIEAHLPGPGRPAQEALGRLLADLTADGHAVLHVTDSARLNVPLRAWLLAEARRNPRLVLALSCHPSESNESVVPGAERRLRLELDPLRRDELGEVLDIHFPHNRFPGEMIDALWTYSRGWPARAALKVRDLLERELVAYDGGAWRLEQEGVDARAFVEEFASLAYDLRQLRAANGPLDRFLDLAALCGDLVPADLLIGHLGLTAAAREDLLDCIDDHLLAGEGAVFRDHQYTHPSFPGLLTYGFLDPLLARILVEEVAEAERPQMAGELLALLRRHAPAVTRGLARLQLTLAEHLATDDERDEVRRELAWWVGLDEAEALTALIVADLQQGRVAPATLLELVWERRRQWLPHRKWAVLEALGASDRELAVAEACEWRLFRADVLLELGRPAEALPEAEQALDLARMAGLRSGRVAAAHSTLGHALLTLGRLDEARYQLETALELARAAGNDLAVATILNNLSLVLMTIGDLPAARACLEQTLLIERSVAPGHRLRKAETLYNLGGVLHGLGDLDGAQTCLEEALAIETAALGSRHPAVARTKGQLGILLQSRGDRSGARRYLEEAFEINRAVLGDDHPEVAATQIGLALLSWGTGDVARAREQMDEAYDRSRATPQGPLPSVIAFFDAMLRDATGADSEAAWEAALEQSAPDIARTVFGDEASTEDVLRLLQLVKNMVGSGHPLARLFDEMAPFLLDPPEPDPE